MRCAVRCPEVYAFAQTTNGSLSLGTMQAVCHRSSIHCSDAGGLPFPCACMLVFCRVRERSDHCAIRAYRVGSQRRRTDCSYSVGTNLGWLSLAGKSRRSLSIRRCGLRTLPASVGRSIPGPHSEFTLGPSRWRLVDWLFIRRGQPSAAWKRFEL